MVPERPTSCTCSPQSSGVNREAEDGCNRRVEKEQGGSFSKNDWIGYGDNARAKGHGWLTFSPSLK